ncbi:MAG: HyaD/HybD family hydrogenase maturation endopeptidase [Actinobacteria bacterium]|nr:HyaD/HybD family hydrogenase maturation endopeptidase [Actinomycetota bacterium]
MAERLLIGIGNTLMKDDGVGVHAARFLKSRVPRDVDVIEGGVYSIDLLYSMEGCSKVLFIDGIDAGEEPGAIFRFTPDDIREKSSGPLSVHEIGVMDLIRTAKLIGQEPPEITLFAVQVKELGIGEELTPEIEGVLPKLAELVVKEFEDG